MNARVLRRLYDKSWMVCRLLITALGRSGCVIKAPRRGVSAVVRSAGANKRALFSFLTVIFILAMATQAMSLIQTETTIPNVGSVKSVGVGVYSDVALANRVSSISWGVLEPGLSKDVTFYIKNEGNSPVILTKTATNWTPSTASTYIILTWDYGGQSINVGASVEVKLTLTVSSGISGITNFSFDIAIAGTG